MSRRQRPNEPLTRDFIIRDPLYGFIEVSERERQLLGTSALQRMSRIKQLGHSYLVYPSAVHTRLEHSLGTMHLASRMSGQLGLDDSKREVIRLAVLLHDLGHGPFSHIFEEVMRWANGDDFSHEDVSRQIITSDEIRLILGGRRFEEVLNLFRSKSIENEIISSSLDADKLDYLRRDSYHVGAAYGVFDLERIIRTLTKAHQPERDYIATHEKGADALEAYRLARYSMHVMVYEHHTRLIAEDMFLRCLKLAKEQRTFSIHNLDMGSSRFLKRYLSLDDSSIQEEILRNSHGKAKTIMLDIRRRHLLKRAYFTRVSKDTVPDPLKRLRLTEMSRERIDEFTTEIANDAHVDEDLLVVHPQSTQIKLYERFEDYAKGRDLPILVMTRRGEPRDLEQFSPISASLEEVRSLYVFCPDDRKARVGRIAERVFGVKNGLPVS